MFDAHLHIVDPRFPLVPNRGYVPEPFTVADYRYRTRSLGVLGGAVVSGSFQGFDTGHLLEALRLLGPGFVGVASLPAATADEEILRLDAGGVRGLRVDLHRDRPPDLDATLRLAARAADLAGWHVELYVDSRRLPSLAPRLAGLPAPLVVDHLGLSRQGFPHLLELVAGGARVKASGFGRGDLDVPSALRAIDEVDPGALIFGTDLPSTRARRPFRDADVELVRRTLGPGSGRRALRENAALLYGLEVVDPPGP